MQSFLKKIKTRAKKNPKKILFPDFDDKRVKEAIKIIKKEKTAIPFTIEGLDYIEATKILKKGVVDALICGPKGNSKERILPALKIIKTKHGERASSFFIMILPKNVDKDAANGGILIFADCALNIDPNEKELAQIAIDSANSAKKLGLNPKVAILSFSTAGSSQDEHVKKIRKAAEIAKKKMPNLQIEGELQADAALMDTVAKIKDPESKIAGRANVLIFPNLESGNIAYKLVERLAGAKAIGPIIQGLNKPVNELSRACSVEDIVNLAAITSVL